MENAGSSEDSWNCRFKPDPFRKLLGEILGGETSNALPLAAYIQPLSTRHAIRLASLVGISSAPLVLEGINARLEVQFRDGEDMTAHSNIAWSKTAANAQIRLQRGAGEPEISVAMHMILARPADAAAVGRRQTVSLSEAETVFRVTAGQINAYAQASGDSNPIHLDLDYCASLGLPERIVHGTLLATLAQTAAGASTGKAMSVRFLAPCYAGEELHLAVSEKETGGRALVMRGDGTTAVALNWRPLDGG